MATMKVRHPYLLHDELDDHDEGEYSEPKEEEPGPLEGPGEGEEDEEQ